MYKIYYQMINKISSRDSACVAGASIPYLDLLAYYFYYHQEPVIWISTIIQDGDENLQKLKCYYMKDLFEKLVHK